MYVSLHFLSFSCDFTFRLCHNKKWILLKLIIHQIVKARKTPVLANRIYPISFPAVQKYTCVLRNKKGWSIFGSTEELDRIHYIKNAYVLINYPYLHSSRELGWNVHLKKNDLKNDNTKLVLLSCSEVSKYLLISLPPHCLRD